LKAPPSKPIAEGGGKKSIRSHRRRETCRMEDVGPSGSFAYTGVKRKNWGEVKSWRQGGRGVTYLIPNFDVRRGKG